MDHILHNYKEHKGFGKPVVLHPQWRSVSQGAPIFPVKKISDLRDHDMASFYKIHGKQQIWKNRTWLLLFKDHRSSGFKLLQNWWNKVYLNQENRRLQANEDQEQFSWNSQTTFGLVKQDFLHNNTEKQIIQKYL